MPPCVSMSSPMSPHSRRCVLRYVDRSIREKFVYAHVHKFRERNILRPIFGDTAGETDLFRITQILAS